MMLIGWVWLARPAHAHSSIITRVTRTYFYLKLWRERFTAETKSERCRDEVKDYIHRNIIVTLYKGFMKD